MNNKFNKDVEDFGWSEMQKMLDRDLPVAVKKRRRGLVFWLFLLGSLLAVSGTFIYQLKIKNVIASNEATALNVVVNNSELKTNSNSELNNSNNKRELKTNNSSKLNNSNSNSELALVNSELNKSINKRELKTNNSSKLNNSNSNSELTLVNSELNKSINKGELNTNNSSKLNNSNSNSELALVNSELNNVINKRELNTNNSSKLNTSAIDEVISNHPAHTKPLITNELEVNKRVLNSDKNNDELNTPPQYLSEKTNSNNTIDVTQGVFIPLEELLALNTNKPKEIKSNSVINSALGTINMLAKTTLIKPNFISKAHFGITTGIHTEGGKKLDGWQLGLVMNKQFKSNLSVSIGLNFRTTTVNADSPLTYFKVELANNTGIGTSAQSPVPARKLTLSKLNYSELPISLNYHFKGKWSLSTGLKMAYLMSTNISTSGDSTLFILQGQGALSKNAYATLDQNDLSQVNALGLQRWDFAALAGLNYNLTKRIQLSLRYDYGLKNSLKRPNWSAYNRFIGFNVVYYIK